MDQETFQALVAAFGVVWGVVWGGQKAGLIPNKVAKDPELTKALVGLNKTTAEVSKVLVAIKDTGESNASEISILRIQHGDQAPQGEYESWKNSPEDRRCWRAAVGYSSASAFMAEVTLRMKMAEIEGQDPKEYMGSARAALDRHDRTKADFA